MSNASRTSVEEFWELRALKMSSGIDDLGGMQWEMLGFLAIGWVLVYLIIWRGLHNSGKVTPFKSHINAIYIKHEQYILQIVWVMAVFPYIVLLILLIRAVTLDGAGDGLLVFFKPDWERLKDPQPWLDAGSQVFYSFGLAIGTLFALGSFNTFNNNCYK
jgi:solute carrier family 6 GABA transporter-like protein 1